MFFDSAYSQVKVIHSNDLDQILKIKIIKSTNYNKSYAKS